MGRRVLVVDDNADIANLTALLLQGHGHEVRTAGDGTSALQIAEAQRPEVVFLDVHLPGIDGFEVGRRLRSSFGQEVRVVILSGYVDSDVRDRAEEAGLDGVVEKPVELEDLEQTLLRLIG